MTRLEDSVGRMGVFWYLVLVFGAGDFRIRGPSHLFLKLVEETPTAKIHLLLVAQHLTLGGVVPRLGGVG